MVGAANVAIYVAGAALAHDAGNREGALKARFISEYPAHAARLGAPLENIHCRFSALTSRTASGKEQQSSFKGEFFVRGQSRQQIADFPAGAARADERREVFCITPESTFALARQSPNAPYVVEKFSDATNQKHLELASVAALRRVDSILQAPLRTRDVPLAILLEHATLDDIESVERDGTACLRLSLRFEPGKYYKRCTVLLDPDMEYAIREYETEWWPFDAVKPGPVRHQRGLVHCQRTKDGFIVPKHVFEEDLIKHASGEEIKRVREYEIENVALGGVEAAQFTIMAFGLPDATLRRKAGWYPFDRWYFWSLVCAAVLAWLYLYKRSRTGAHLGGSLS